MVVMMILAKCVHYIHNTNKLERNNTLLKGVRVCVCFVRGWWAHNAGVWFGVGCACMCGAFSFLPVAGVRVGKL